VGLSNLDVVVYALAVLGGSHATVYSEDIAAKCYELDPPRFSWRLERYRQLGWPDKYIAKTALEDAKKVEHGSLVEGSYALDPARDGWRLTTGGARWFADNRHRIEAELGAPRAALDARQADRFRKYLECQPLFRRFLRTGNIRGCERFELTEMLRCSPDASREVIERKLGSLHSMAVLVGDRQYEAFLECCQDFFSEVG